jgi:hypothetical protein
VIPIVSDSSLDLHLLLENIKKNKNKNKKHMAGI